MMEKPATTRKRIWGLSPNVFFLGIVSLLTDVSSEMIFTILPLFLSQVLKAPFTAIGLIGGLSESTDAIFRIFSGWFSDKIKKRKLLTVLGYSISTIAKPFMYLASSWGAVLGVRFGDRLGKGIRTSSRDALIADSVAAGERGKGFGLHRAMDTLGAVLGLAIARWIGGFDNRFKVFLAIMAVFTLGNSSDFFVILRAWDLDVSLIYVVVMLVLFNITYAAVSLPAGMLSDKLGRKRVITLGWFIYALVYLGFALASSPWQVWLLFAGYGIYYGIAEGVARALVADLVPAEKRGTAYGLYHGVVGLSLLPASLIAGWLWEAVSPAAPFYLGAGLAFLAMLGMMGLVRE
jgi:MFS family permease